MHGNALKTTSLIVAFVFIASFTLIPASSAYGKENWQTTFAGTFVSPGSGNSGFWGWCAFGGGTPSSAGAPVTSGTDADCEESFYFGPSHAIQAHESISGTAWDMEPCTIAPCVTPNDFFITSGTMTISGPDVVQHLGTVGPLLLSLGCTITGETATCSLLVWEGLGTYNPDTGIPTVAGHYNLNSFLTQPGEFQIQVTQLP